MIDQGFGKLFIIFYRNRPVSTIIFSKLEGLFQIISTCQRCIGHFFINVLKLRQITVKVFTIKELRCEIFGFPLFHIVVISLIPLFQLVNVVIIETHKESTNSSCSSIGTNRTRSKGNCRIISLNLDILQLIVLNLTNHITTDLKELRKYLSWSLGIIAFNVFKRILFFWCIPLLFNSVSNLFFKDIRFSPCFVIFSVEF